MLILYKLGLSVKDYIGKYNLGSNEFMGLVFEGQRVMSL